MPAGRTIEIEGDLTIESLSNDPIVSGGNVSVGIVKATVQTVGSSSGETIILEIDQLPPRQTVRGITRMIWRSRRTLAALLVRSTQSFQLNVAGQRWLSVEPKPSRLGTLIGTPGLRFRFVAGSLLAMIKLTRR